MAQKSLHLDVWKAQQEKLRDQKATLKFVLSTVYSENAYYLKYGMYNEDIDKIFAFEQSMASFQSYGEEMNNPLEAAQVMKLSDLRTQYQFVSISICVS